MFGIAFLDSHRHVQFQVGYAWHHFWGPRDGLQAGLGYTAMIAQRPDIWNGVPFPVVLPLAALRYGKATLEVTFIPTLSRQPQPRQHAVRVRPRRARLDA